MLCWQRRAQGTRSHDRCVQQPGSDFRDPIVFSHRSRSARLRRSRHIWLSMPNWTSTLSTQRTKPQNSSHDGSAAAPMGKKLNKKKEKKGTQPSPWHQRFRVSGSCAMHEFSLWRLMGERGGDQTPLGRRLREDAWMHLPNASNSP